MSHLHRPAPFPLSSSLSCRSSWISTPSAWRTSPFRTFRSTRPPWPVSERARGEQRWRIRPAKGLSTAHRQPRDVLADVVRLPRPRLGAGLTRGQCGRRSPVRPGRRRQRGRFGSLARRAAPPPRLSNCRYRASPAFRVRWRRRTRPRPGHGSRRCLRRARWRRCRLGPGTPRW
jgi:hypothetical protein